jgi:hypothetical protein
MRLASWGALMVVRLVRVVLWALKLGNLALHESSSWCYLGHPGLWTACSTRDPMAS